MHVHSQQLGDNTTTAVGTMQFYRVVILIATS